jgi:hypothetical protein
LKNEESFSLLSSRDLIAGSSDKNAGQRPVTFILHSYLLKKEKTMMIITNNARGLRNNNPGNIRYIGSPWVGLDTPPTDGAFCRFKEAKYGIRALARTLLTYDEKYKLNTIYDIITRFAPPCENNTDSYIRHVCAELDCRHDEKIGIRPNIFKLTRAIIRHENGRCPYSDLEIMEGIALVSA